MKNCCDKPALSDLTNGIGPKRHLFCQKCKAHFYNNRQWTAKEWEAWVNDVEW